MNKKFYAVIGYNGVAVMDSWDGAVRIQRYIKKASVMGFETFTEAEDWALCAFSEYLPPEIFVNYLRPNQAVFRKNLRPDFA